MLRSVFTILLAGLFVFLLYSAFNIFRSDIKITALGERNTASNANEVIITKIIVDGKMLNFNELSLPEHIVVRGDSLFFNPADGEHISFTLPLKGTVKIYFYTHDWSGKVLVESGKKSKTVDLYSTTPSQYVYQNNAYSFVFFIIFLCLIIYLQRKFLLKHKKQFACFFTLFAVIFVYCIIRNPVYQPTNVYIFPNNGFGNHSIYYTTVNGYHNSLVKKIPEDSYYANFNNISGLNRIYSYCSMSDCGITEYSIPQVTSFNVIKGDRLVLEADEKIEIELPAKEIYMQIVYGAMPEIRLTSVKLIYERSLLNRSVAATFPFTANYSWDRDSTKFPFTDMYTSSRHLFIYIKGVPDVNAYDTTYLLTTSEADYVAPSITKFKAEGFVRATAPWYNTVVVLYCALAAALAALFIMYVPINIYKAYKSCNRKDKLFMLLTGIYLLAIWYVFRHSLYFFYDGILDSVVTLGFDNHLFGNLYMIMEYVFYILDYASRPFLMLLVLYVMIIYFKKILDNFIPDNFNLITYVICALSLLSPQILLAALNSQRMDTAVLFCVLSLILYLYYKMVSGKKKHFVMSIVSMLIAVAFRMDFIIMFLPILFLEWINNVTLKKTLIYCVAGLILIVYTMGVHTIAPTKSYMMYQLSKTMLLWPIVKQMPETFTEHEKQIIENAFPGGIERMKTDCRDYYGCTSPKIISTEDKAAFNKLVINKVFQYPDVVLKFRIKQFKERVLGINADFYSNTNYNFPFGNMIAEIPHKNSLFDHGENIIISLLGIQRGLIKTAWPFFIFIMINALLSFKLRYTGVISIGILLQYLVVFLYASGFFAVYNILMVIWCHFAPGLVLAEIIMLRQDKVIPIDYTKNNNS